MPEDTEITTTDDGNGAQTDDGPKPCHRLFAIRETKNGTEMWTCTGCRCSFTEKAKFRELEACQR